MAYAIWSQTTLKRLATTPAEQRNLLTTRELRILARIEHCSKCGYYWRKRRGRPPQRCPSCKSTLFMCGSLFSDPDPTQPTEPTAKDTGEQKEKGEYPA